MALKRAKESGDWKQLRRGWCWGPQKFREEMLDWTAARRSGGHSGVDIRESEEQKATRIIGQMLRKEGRQPQELAGLAKGDRTKSRIAARLRAETTTCLPCLPTGRRQAGDRQAAGR